MNILGLAARNLTRHGARSAIAVGAIAAGVVALMIAGGFIDWILWAMREDTIQSRLGHIQVVRPGYIQRGSADPYAYLLPEQAAIRRTLAAEPGVVVVAPRLNFSGLASFGDTTVSFIGDGVDVAKERHLSRHLTVVQGQDMDPRERQGILVGEGLAQDLGVGPGDAVVLLVTAASGGVHAVEARVRGLFYTSTKAYDDKALRVPLALAQELLRVQGVHQWILLLQDTERVPELMEELRKRHGNGDEFEFVPWYELADFYNKTVVLFARQLDVLWFMIAAIIIMTISNTMVRAVLERTGEIGTLMALGNRRRFILGSFVLEGLLLGIAGGLVGLVLGVALAYIISRIGIPMPPPPGMSRGFTGEIRLTLPLFGDALFMAVLTTVLASLYPAWKASRKSIVDALRHNR